MNQFIEEDSYKYGGNGDGPCLIRKTSAHIQGDPDKFEQIARDLNTHEAEYRKEYVKLIEADFPLEVTIGVTEKPKCLAKARKMISLIGL